MMADAIAFAPSMRTIGRMHRVGGRVVETVMVGSRLLRIEKSKRRTRHDSVENGEI